MSSRSLGPQLSDINPSRRRGFRVGSATVGQLWQVPLLLVSLGLFGYAGYLLIDPQPKATFAQKFETAEAFVRAQRPAAAVEQLNKLITGDDLLPPQSAKVHLAMSRALEQYQQQEKQSIPSLQQRVIEQTFLATNAGAKLDADDLRRLGDSYAATKKPAKALDAYRRAGELSPSLALRLQRKVINLLLETGQNTEAQKELQAYIASADLTDAERGSALGERAQLLVDAERFGEARVLLDQALSLAHDADPVQQGEVNYRLGYAAWKLSDLPAAENYLRVARDQLQPSHPLDADACYLLGRINQALDKPAVANSFYDIVLDAHPGSRRVPMARLGRGMCRVLLKADDSGRADLAAVAAQVRQDPALAALKPDVIPDLKQAASLLSVRGNQRGALELLAAEAALDGGAGTSFFTRLAGVCEKYADDLRRPVAGESGADRVRREQAQRQMRTRAGDAEVALSQQLAATDDKGYGETLWHGIELYESAENAPAAAAALEVFIDERPSDPLTPEALLRLGKLYGSVGQFDKAIATYQRNQKLYPQTLAATKSAVPLAMAYIARGPDSYLLAETTLKSVIENNAVLDPASDEFKTALVELGRLYYQTDRYDAAIGRLQEFVDRYPADPRLGTLYFLLADSNRKSAQAMTAKATAMRGDPANAAEADKLLATQRDRLATAKGQYDQAVDFYRAHPPEDAPGKLYQKLSHFYRGDCLYDLGRYEEAIKLYDAAAFRYQNDPSALAGYVQIVNAYCRLGKTQEAKTANERAKWLLRRIPPEAFSNGSFSMPKEYWEQWLKWSNDSGLW